jgi:2-polyprenyl-3-methyl-5-hydroxy-6-metoxy-1,4-benzoquinol methylase
MTQMNRSDNGGYDAGYAACPCFWGRTPGSLVTNLLDGISVAGWRVLDAGCGEGKNSIHLASAGAEVVGVELSAAALDNARNAWPELPKIKWVHGDIRDLCFEAEQFDLVLAYGLLHCLGGPAEIAGTVRSLQTWTKPSGYHLICAFNDRHQDLVAHPGFNPTLLQHEQYVTLYRGWALSSVSDRDLEEIHPHNGIPHSHSMTRFIAQKPSPRLEVQEG